MRHYHIYLVEDEIAQMYFGEESKLFQLFHEAEQTTSPLKSEVLAKQIRYITKPIDDQKVRLALKKGLEHRTDFVVYPSYFLLDGGSGNSRTKLMIRDSHLHMASLGDPDTETIFFEQLRKIETSFLAMDFEHHRFGWLNPIKQANFIS